MKRTVLAAALLASSAGTAFAADAFLYNLTGVTQTVGIFGAVGLYGVVGVSSSAGAAIDNQQTVALHHVSLEPLHQSSTQGAVTVSVDNLAASTAADGYAYRNSAQSASFEASANTTSSQSASASGSGWIAGGSTRAAGSQQSMTANQSSSQHRTGGTNGAAFVAGGAVSASGSSQRNQVSGYVLPGLFGVVAGGSASHGTSGYRVGAAGAVWGASSSTDAASDAHRHADASTSRSSSASGSAWQANASQSEAKAASSHAVSASEQAETARSASWGFGSHYEAQHTETSGGITTVTDTRQAGTLTATTGGNAATGVKGNLGINVAMGIDNAQSNDVSLASVDIGNVFGSAQAFSNQSSAGHARIDNFVLNASIGDGSLAGVSGNVGVNVASGVSNVQNNSLAGSMTTTHAGLAKTVAMVATDDNTQAAGAQIDGRFVGTAMLGANTLTGATGNIGVNIAGGAGNLQHNGLAIAALNSGH
jgi:hypothetical protein